MFEITPIFVLLIIFGSIVTIVYFGIRKKERMAMMERGVDPAIFHTPAKKNTTALKYGILLVGVALGILLGKILATTNAFMYEEEVAYFSMIFLFGGLSLLIYHFLSKKMNEEEGK
jgi:hypothetical protein